MNGIAQRGAGMLQKAKETLNLLKNGSARFIQESKESKLLQQRQQAGEALARDEYRLIYRNRQDFKKVVPFFLVALVVPELIPVLIIKGSNLIPSTCLSAEDKEKKLLKMAEKRSKVCLDAVAHVEKGGIFKPVDLMDKKILEQLAINQRQCFEFDRLPYASLALFSKFYGFSSFWPSFWLRKKLKAHFDYLKRDSELIKDKVPELNKQELISALEERGISTMTMESTEMKRFLTEWTSMQCQTKPTIPEGLLITHVMVKRGISLKYLEHQN
jgi:LETM1 and EF-hand domain-containing protein 1